MTGKLRSHLCSNIVGYVALFVALSLGTAWAATLSKNSVGPKQISKNAVKEPEIAKDAVRASEILDNAVDTDEVSDASLLSEDFAPGELPQGEQGVPGAPGSDATKLFGYIRDPGTMANASLEYGKGITNVVDGVDDGVYTVTFNRDLANCAVMAVSGYGNPHPGNPESIIATPDVRIQGAGNVEVTFISATTDLKAETSFLITAFC